MLQYLMKCQIKPYINIAIIASNAASQYCIFSLIIIYLIFTADVSDSTPIHDFFSYSNLFKYDHYIPMSCGSSHKLVLCLKQTSVVFASEIITFQV